MSGLRVAVSKWDGTPRTHLYEEDQPLLQAKTLCGKSVLGWEKQDMDGQEIVCAVCSKVGQKILTWSPM